ncbi:hypothetical protein BTVI_03212 [Pitangus sulphuratus]|nr:hypothetical protein BTVI_03212 [Pitangus sulphuratus]
MDKQLVGLVHSSESQWTSVINSVPLGSILGLTVFFRIFINDINKGIESTLNKFTDASKLSGAVDTSEGWNAIQKGLVKLKKWVHGNLITFNKTK